MKTSAMVITKLWKTSCFSKKAAAAVTLIAPFVSKKNNKAFQRALFSSCSETRFYKLTMLPFLTQGQPPPLPPSSLALAHLLRD